MIGSDALPEKFIDPDNLRSFTQGVLESRGVPTDDAEAVADCLIFANLSGIDSHGVVRLAHYVRRLENGTINAKAQVKFSRPKPGVLAVDGDDGLGHAVTARAIDEGIETCRKQGSLTIAIGNSSHFGMAAFYFRKITAAGLAGLVTTHSDVRIVPTGARKPFAGTNPISFGFPTSGEPFVLDFAASSVAFGKIALAKAENKPIPPDWGLDEDGEPTTDPCKLVGMHPIAGHKGSGLAMVVDILCAMFTGMPVGPHINKMYEEMNSPRKLAHFICLWDPAAFVGLDNFQKRMDSYIEELHALPRRNPATAVMYPGEPEARRRAERFTSGIPIEPGLLNELRLLGTRLAIDTAFLT